MKEYIKPSVHILMLSPEGIVCQSQAGNESFSSPSVWDSADFWE